MSYARPHILPCRQAWHRLGDSQRTHHAHVFVIQNVAVVYGQACEVVESGSNAHAPARQSLTGMVQRFDVWKHVMRGMRPSVSKMEPASDWWDCAGLIVPN